MAFGTPPKNFSARTCASIQSGSVWVRLAHVNQTGPSESVTGGTEDGDEDLCRMHHAGRRIGDWDRVAGIIGLHNRTRLMPVAEARAGAVLKGPKLFTKPRIAVALWMGCAVFLPQKHQGNALALQLRGNLGPVRFLMILWWTPHPLKQRCLQRGVIIMPRRQRPAVEPGLTRPQKIGRHRRLAQLQPKPDLPNRETLFMRQP